MGTVHSARRDVVVETIQRLIEVLRARAFDSLPANQRLTHQVIWPGKVRTPSCVQVGYVVIPRGECEHDEESKRVDERRKTNRTPTTSSDE